MRKLYKFFIQCIYIIFTLVAIGTKIFKMADAILKTHDRNVFSKNMELSTYERINNFVEKYV